MSEYFELDEDTTPGWTYFGLSSLPRDGKEIVFYRSDEKFFLPKPPEYFKWKADDHSLYLIDVDGHWWGEWEMPGGEIHCCLPNDTALWFIDTLRPYLERKH